CRGVSRWSQGGPVRSRSRTTASWSFPSSPASGFPRRTRSRRSSAASWSGGRRR
ncbi:MAG: hypothetical protein AVDCRST_MAG59-1734, partial [uncultured Thermomicrobiales bacterium]